MVCRVHVLANFGKILGFHPTRSCTPLTRLYLLVLVFHSACLSHWLPQSAKFFLLFISAALLLETLLQGSEVGDSIRQAFRHFAQRSANGFIIPEWLPVPDNLQYNAAVHRLDSVIYSLIRQRRKELQGAVPSGIMACLHVLVCQLA